MPSVATDIGQKYDALVQALRNSFDISYIYFSKYILTVCAWNKKLMTDFGAICDIFDKETKIKRFCIYSTECLVQYENKNIKVLLIRDLSVLYTTDTPGEILITVIDRK